MDFEHVEHGELSSTVLQSNNRTDQPPPAYGATGTRRNPFGSNYPTMIERIDIDLTVCKAEITGLETQATQQAVRMERLQQELRIAKEDRGKMTETIDELRSQVLELTSKIEMGAALLKFNAYCVGKKKAKAYKLYHNYLSISIQAQTESF